MYQDAYTMISMRNASLKKMKKGSLKQNANQWFIPYKGSACVCV